MQDDVVGGLCDRRPYVVECLVGEVDRLRDAARVVRISEMFSGWLRSCRRTFGGGCETVVDM